jgi:hypothetical protein
VLFLVTQMSVYFIVHPLTRYTWLHNVSSRYSAHCFHIAVKVGLITARELPRFLHLYLNHRMERKAGAVASPGLVQLTRFSIVPFVRAPRWQLNKRAERCFSLFRNRFVDMNFSCDVWELTSYHYFRINMLDAHRSFQSSSSVDSDNSIRRDASIRDRVEIRIAGTDGHSLMGIKPWLETPVSLGHETR